MVTRLRETTPGAGPIVICAVASSGLDAIDKREATATCIGRYHQAEGFLRNERHQRGPYGLPDGPDCYGHVPVDLDVVANINCVFGSV